MQLIKQTIEKKYGDKLQKYFKYKNEEWLYNIRASFSISDHFLSNYCDEKNLTKFFNETGIDKDEYYNICYNIYKWWLIHIYCDKKTCIMESSKLMEDLIEYMENKINNKNQLKMVIDLGHDVTVEPMQIFMNKAFGIGYTICNFACNLFFELYKEKINKKNIYFVKYYIDDELKLEINYELFKKKILSIIWTEKQKDDFCRGNIIKVLYPNIFIILAFTLIIIIIGIFILIIYKFYLKKKCDIFSDKENKIKLINKNENIKERNLKKRKRIKNKINENDKELKEII